MKQAVYKSMPSDAGRRENKMARHSESYLIGKAGEAQTWDYLARVGYIRPSAKQRVNIIAAFGRGGLTVQRGFR
jgi:hypothetical protein